MDCMGFLMWLHGGSPLLDGCMVAATALATHSVVWLVAAFLMTCTKRHRAAGIAVVASVAIAYATSDLFLKVLIDVPRPFEVCDLPLIVEPYASSSFPSGHTASSFAASTAILMHDRRWGALAVAFAALVGISRMYLFMHWPVDVIEGALVGVLAGLLATLLVGRFYVGDLEAEG